MPKDAFSFVNMSLVAKFLRKEGLLAIGATNSDFREASEGAFSKRFGPDLLKYVREGDVENIKALVSRYPGLILYRFNPVDVPIAEIASKKKAFNKAQEKRTTEYKNYNAFELALHQPEAKKVKEIVAALFSCKCNDEIKQFIEEQLGYNLGQELLYHAIRGNQQAVIEILKRYPKLLLHRGNIKDYSGRDFKNVTAFELALWALDVRHMAPAMLKCLHQKEEGTDLALELLAQFENVTKDDGGVNYSIGCGLLNMLEDPSELKSGQTVEERYAELNQLVNRHNALIQFNGRIFYFHNLNSPKKLVEITDLDAVNILKSLINRKERPLGVGQLEIIDDNVDLKMIQDWVAGSRHLFKEQHYDFKFLKDTLEGYVSSNRSWRLKQRDAYWCSEVGLAQYYAPTHVAQHYCNPKESFDPENNKVPPTFKENELGRKFDFFNGETHKKESWWPLWAGADSGLSPGLFCGILRGPSGTAWLTKPDEEEIMRAASDLAALTVLCKVRTEEVHELKHQLDSLQTPDDQKPLRM